MTSQSRAIDQVIAVSPAYHEGDVFEYVDRFETIPCRRWVVTGPDKSGSMLSKCGDNVAYFSAATGALQRITGKNSKELVNFHPMSPAMPFPLQVGTTWHGKFRLSAAGEIASPELDESCKVVSFETVTVAAGDFDAFRYDCSTAWTVWPLHGTATETGWYAPAAKTVVKVLNSSDPDWNLELARFSFK